MVLAYPGRIEGKGASGLRRGLLRVRRPPFQVSLSTPAIARDPVTTILFLVPVPPMASGKNHMVQGQYLFGGNGHLARKLRVVPSVLSVFSVSAAPDRMAPSYVEGVRTPTASTNRGTA
jgi:hypothetical protein